MEASLLNSCREGDQIITVNGGAFGARWRTIGERLGLKVHEIVVEWGKPVTLEEIEAALALYPGARAVCMQHSETSTTALHPLSRILPRIKEISPETLTIVDGISSCLTTPMPGTPESCDIYIAGSQKAFMLPPGLAMMMLSKTAWRVVESTPRRTLYFDLLSERRSLANGETSWTPASTIILGLNAAIEIIKAEGLEAVYARHALMGRIARHGVTSLGCKLVAPDAPGDSVTGFYPPSGVEADTLRSQVRKRFGIRLAGGQGKLNGAVVRIGHMGDMDPFDVFNAVIAIGSTARALGGDVNVEAAAQSCMGLF
jgi:aspartate aminotransferase-like enzyme